MRYPYLDVQQHLEPHGGINAMNNNEAQSSALFEIGFRPFFLGAGVFAVVSISLWAMIYLFQYRVATEPLSVFQWHAHEMIYGYALAVVAGFLLTAVANWTGLPTSRGKPLMLMFILWCSARVLYLFGTEYLVLAGLLDLLFILQLLVSITIPIVQKRLWPRMAVISKVMLMMVFNSVFLLGALGHVEEGARIGIYAGLYLIVGLILTIGKNLVPFFIARGVGYQVTIASFRWLDIASLVLFLIFFVLELTATFPSASGAAALALFAVNTVRLGQWHTHGIWVKPLLWGLYLSYSFICFAFLLFGLHYFMGVSKYLAIHAAAVGGIGLITLSMMSRVAIGHTGRDISKPHVLVKVAFALLVLCAIVRVLLPIAVPGLTMDWMRVSFVLWLGAFLSFLWVYVPIFFQPRVDR